MTHHRLPVAAHEGRIIDAIAANQVTVIAGSTGSGKTTLVPRFCLNGGFAGKRMIAVTEPRRIAATSVAEFVAEDLGDGIGDIVGSHIRHERRVGPDTQIVYMTEGILLREFLADPMLSKYAVIVLDEVHERGVNQDLLMALVKRLCEQRPELRVVVMSATIDDAKFADWFGAPIISVEGRTHPVDVRYRDVLDPGDPLVIANAVRDAISATDGDALVFVPDYRTIKDVTELLGGRDVLPEDVTVHALYGQQSPDEQRAVFDRVGKSVILATNVAETSVTLDGVTTVIDTGLVKEMRYLPGKRMSSLKVVAHSRAGCDQRAGRAGRTAPGVCLRLFSEEDYLGLRKFTSPEITRSDLGQVLIQLLAMGFAYDDVSTLDWLSPPRHEDWRAARESLEPLGAIDARAHITPLGRLMAELPLAPSIARMLLAAEEHRCVDAVTTIAASFSTRQIFLRPVGDEAAADDAKKEFEHPRSDFLTMLNAVRAWRRAKDKAAFCGERYLNHDALTELELGIVELKEILRNHGIPTEDAGDSDAIGKAVTAGLIGNLLRTDDGKTFSTSKVQGVRFFPGSSLRERRDVTYAVALEIVDTTRTWARTVQEVRPRWLKEIAPEALPKRKKNADHKKDRRRELRGQRPRRSRR